MFCPPDNRPVLVYTNPKRAYANETRETRSLLRASISSLKKLLATGGLSAEDRYKLADFKDRLDKYNIDVLNAYKTSNRHRRKPSATAKSGACFWEAPGDWLSRGQEGVVRAASSRYTC